MKPSITPKAVSDGQKNNLVRLVEDAARKAVGVAVDELSATDVLNSENFQRVLAQGDKLVSAITILVKKQIADLAENIIGRLRLISGGKKLVIPATERGDILAEAGDIFSYVDPDFGNYGCNVKGQLTEEIEVQVYEMIEDGTFGQIFGSLGKDLDRLCLSQTQVKSFVVNHSDMLRAEGYATFFLFKTGDKFFVAFVYRHDDGRLRVHVFHFSFDFVWFAEYRHRVVLPQLAP